MKLKTFLSAIVLALVAVSCSNDDNGGGGDPLGISFETTTYDATFYTAGQSGVIEIAGGDEDINISLAEGTPTSITYNSAAGVVEWTSLLPLGTTVVTVMAEKGGEEATTELTISNVFQGDFEGGYNIDPMDESLTSVNFALQFNTDGTLSLDDDGNTGVGTWSVDGNTLMFTYAYDSDSTTFYTYQGNVVYDETEAYVSGFYYDGEEVDEGMEQGFFRIDIN